MSEELDKDLLDQHLKALGYDPQEVAIHGDVLVKTLIENQELKASLAQRDQELERERMRLAACGIAALGYFDGCHEDYKSASLGDVLGLQERFKNAEAEAARLKAELASSKTSKQQWEASCVKNACEITRLAERLSAADRAIDAARDCAGRDNAGKAQFQPNCDGEAEDLLNAIASYDAKDPQ